MLEGLQNIEILRKYLLGQIDDEKKLDLIEQRLLTDQDYLAELELAEEELIDDYLTNSLEPFESAGFKKFFLDVPERREKIRLNELLYQSAAEETITTPEIVREKQSGFFEQWIPSPRFAFGLVVFCLLGIVLMFWFIFSQNDSSTVITELKSLYKNERPLESRISSFDFAPQNVTRGESNVNTEKKIILDKIESELRNSVSVNPNAENHFNLGVFFLTEKKYDRAIEQFKSALKVNQNAPAALNNLGAAFFEKAKLSEGENKNELLRKSLAELNKSIELDQNLPEAYFNKALVLEELKDQTEAIKIWREYLKKEENSRWRTEAQNRLENLENPGK